MPVLLWSLTCAVWMKCVSCDLNYLNKIMLTEQYKKNPKIHIISKVKKSIKHIL